MFYAYFFHKPITAEFANINEGIKEQEVLASTLFKITMLLESSFSVFLIKSTLPVKRVCLCSLVFCFPSGDSIHPHFTIG